MTTIYGSDTPNSFPLDSFGSRLYAEMKRLSGFDVVIEKLDYAAIQQLKSADRSQALKLFARSATEVLEHMKTQEPEEVASLIVEEFRKSADETGASSWIITAI